ncbi:trichohyalin-like [Mauremys mutica]|uniref:trichohyalin-like n=1 Tax=Mauremys mutica TaxID=74926 RepID=UPI001D1694AC|nr:trichohyalin-like [Mauremys mutica]
MSETAHNFSSTTTIRDELGANYTSKKCSKPVGIGVSNSIENSSCGVIIPPSISSCSAVFGTTLLFNFEVCLPISTSKAKPDMMVAFQQFLRSWHQSPVPTDWSPQAVKLAKDNPAVGHRKDIVLTFKTDFPASGERKSPGSDPGKSEERQEMSQTSDADKQTWLREELEKFWESKNAKDGESQSIRREQKRTSGSPDGKSQLIPQEQEQMSESPEQKMEELPSWRVNIKTDTKCSQLEVMSLLDKKLEGDQRQLQDQLPGQAKKIEQMSNSLNSRDYKVIQGMGKQKALSSTELATKRDLRQLEICLEEKFSGLMSTLRGSSADEKLGQQEILERKMEELSSWRENLKADITSSQLEVMSLLDKKLEGVRSQLQDPLSELAKQIEEEKALSSTELATKRDLQQLEICLEEKFSGLMSSLTGSSAEEKLGQQEILERKMEELSSWRENLKADITSSQLEVMSLLDKKLEGVRSQLQDPLSELAKQIEEEKALSSTELATKRDLQQLEICLEEKFSGLMSTLRGSSADEKLGQQEILERKMEELSSWRENLKADITSSQLEVMSLLDKKLEGVRSQLQDPLSELAKQIEEEKALSSTELATKRDLQQLEICLEEKFSGLMSTLRGSSADEKLGQQEILERKMEELSSWRENLKADITSSQLEVMSLLDKKLEGVRSQLQDPLSELAKQIEEEKALSSTELATKRDLQQLEICLEEKFSGLMSSLTGSSAEEKLGQQEILERKMEELSSWRENLKADITSSQLEVMSLLDKKLEGVRSQLQDPLSELAKQIEEEKALSSTELATKRDLQQLEICLEEKFSGLMSTLRGSSADEKLGQQEILEKKMEELLKAEIKTSLWEWKTLLDEKLKSVQTQLETQLRNPLSHLATQITQLTTRLSSIDENASQEEEKKHEALATLQFANKDELQQEKYLKKQSIYSKSTPNLSSVEKEREKSSSGNFTPRSFVREVICKQVITDLKLVLKELTISRMGYGQRLIWKRDFASRFSAGFGMIRQSTDRSPIVVRATFSEDEESVELQEPDPDSGGKTSLEENVGVTSASSPLEDVVLFSVDRMTRTLYNLSVSSEESSHPVLDVLGPSTRESHSLH